MTSKALALDACDDFQIKQLKFVQFDHFSMGDDSGL
jgi:hypothetical protein